MTICVAESEGVFILREDGTPPQPWSFAGEAEPARTAPSTGEHVVVADSAGTALGGEAPAGTALAGRPSLLWRRHCPREVRRSH